MNDTRGGADATATGVVIGEGSPDLARFGLIPKLELAVLEPADLREEVTQVIFLPSHDAAEFAAEPAARPTEDIPAIKDRLAQETVSMMM